MNMTITSQNKGEYVLIETKGSLQTKEDLFKHAHMVYEEILKHGLKKILINVLETNFPLGLFPYFELAQDYIHNFPPEIRNLKIAIVISQKFKEAGAFWETVCVNRGFQYFAFNSFQDATNWLLK